MKKSMIGDVPGNVLGMLSDLTSKLQHGAITPEQLEGFLKGKNPFEKTSDLMAEWQDFWKRHGVETDLSGVKIPAHKKGFDRLIVIPQGLTINQAFALCQNEFPVWSYTDNPDKSVTKNNRNTGKSYAIWVRDRKEADEELKNLSADDLKEKGIKGITLLERLVYELKYFDETGKHLDIEYITLCSGSRFSDGSVPCVVWCGDELGVRWFDSGFARFSLRGRAVVTLES